MAQWHRVRGVVGLCPVRAGCPPNGPPVLAAHLGPLSPDPPLQLDFGTGSTMLDSLRSIPLLGSLLPAPQHLVDGYQGVVTVRIEPSSPYECYAHPCYSGVLQDLLPP